MSFPSPVGGVPVHDDFVPSVLFATMFALLLPVMIYRIYDRTSRVTLLIGTIIFSVEHVVLFALRARAAHSFSGRASRGLATYMQLDFATGYIGMVSDTTQFLGSLLVNTTWGSDTWRQCPEFESQSWSWRHNPSNTLPAQPPEGTPDQPRKRFWFRRFREIYGLLFLAATITGVLANSRYHRAPDDAEIAAWIGRLRYASASVVLFLSIILIGVILYARTLPRVPEHAISRLLAIVSMCIIVAIYRLSIMHNETTSLTSFAPGSQNQTRDKVLFYIFHIFPEWTVEAILWCTNMRQTYQTGYFGDWRWRDETPKEKEKREEKEKKREEKRREREEKRLGKKTKAIGKLIEDDAYSLSAGAGDSATANERIV